VVEGGGDRRALREAVVGVQGALDAVDDGLGYLTQIGVAIPVTILEARAGDVLEVFRHWVLLSFAIVELLFAGWAPPVPWTG